MCIYGRSRHNTAIFLNCVTKVVWRFGSLLHNLCFVFQMLLDLERGAKTYKTNGRFFKNSIFGDFLKLFWKKSEMHQNRHFFKIISKIPPKLNLKKIGHSFCTFLLLFLNPKAFEKQNTGCGAMTQNVRLLLWHNSRKLQCYSEIHHIWSKMP